MKIYDIKAVSVETGIMVRNIRYWMSKYKLNADRLGKIIIFPQKTIKIIKLIDYLKKENYFNNKFINSIVSAIQDNKEDNGELERHIEDINRIIKTIYDEEGKEDVKKFVIISLGEEVKIKDGYRNDENRKKNLEELFKSAKKMETDKQYNNAINQYNEILKSDRNSIRAMMGMAICHANLEHLSKAIYYAKRILTIDDDNTEARNLLGNLYYLGGLRDKADKEWSQARDSGKKDELL